MGTGQAEHSILLPSSHRLRRESGYRRSLLLNPRHSTMLARLTWPPRPWGEIIGSCGGNWVWRSVGFVCYSTAKEKTRIGFCLVVWATRGGCTSASARSGFDVTLATREKKRGGSLMDGPVKVSDAWFHVKNHNSQKMNRLRALLPAARDRLKCVAGGQI